jgi:hypothetical protein
MPLAYQFFGVFLSGLAGGVWLAYVVGVNAVRRPSQKEW